MQLHFQLMLGIAIAFAFVGIIKYLGQLSLDVFSDEASDCWAKFAQATTVLAYVVPMLIGFYLLPNEWGMGLTIGAFSATLTALRKWWFES